MKQEIQGLLCSLNYKPSVKVEVVVAAGQRDTDISLVVLVKFRVTEASVTRVQLSLSSEWYNLK